MDENEILIEFEKYWENEIIKNSNLSDIKELKDLCQCIFEDAYSKGFVRAAEFYKS